MTQLTDKASPWALLPMLLFLALFIGSGLYYQSAGVEFAFYEISRLPFCPPLFSLCCWPRAVSISVLSNSLKAAATRLWSLCC